MKPTAPSPEARVAAMRASLKILLDRVPGAREVLPHLAALEITLEQRGLVGLANVSPTTMRRVCSQLASLPMEADDAPLQDLQQVLLGWLNGAKPAEPTTPAAVDMDVREVSHSDFMAAAAAQNRPT